MIANIVELSSATAAIQPEGVSPAYDRCLIFPFEAAGRIEKAGTFRNYEIDIENNNYKRNKRIMKKMKKVYNPFMIAYFIS
jgi:hypothetical protein